MVITNKMEKHAKEGVNLTSSSTTEDLDKEVQELLPSLPKAKGWLSFGLSLYQGFWYPTGILRNVISFQRHFQALDQDIILASQPKSGTTWLKALIYSIVNRTNYTSSNTPLLASSPHELVPFLEFSLFAKKEVPDLASFSSPRLFATHVPYTSLPESIKASGCRLVYVCRNPFDVVVSFWHFATDDRPEEEIPWSMEEYFHAFFQGTSGFGPFWDHVLEYWKASLENPQKVLFFKYEDLKEDIVSHLKKLAEFIGSPFSLEEEGQGVIEEISKLCSLSSLKDLEVNKNGKYMPNFSNKAYFRKGDVGGSINYLSPSMRQHYEDLMKEKLSGSGLTFKMFN